MKRILIVVHVYPPEVAPAGFMIQDLALELKKKGHEVTILTGWPSHPSGYLFPNWKSRFKDVADQDGVKVIRSGHLFGNRKSMLSRFFYYLTFALSSLINGLFSAKYDVVICLSTPFFGSWTSWLLAKLKGAKFIYNIFDLYPEAGLYAGLIKQNSFIYKVWYWQDHLLCKVSDLIITLSKPLEKEILKRGINPSKVSVIPFWIDDERIKPGNRDNSWRTQQQIPLHKFVVLYAGTIGYISGVNVIVDAAKFVESDPNVLILIVGEGVAKQELERQALEKQCSNVRFLPFQPEEVLSDMQATADVGLITNLPQAGQTSIPSKILGYLAAGKAVIASVSDDSGTAELINSGNCGLIARCQDPKDLADHILYAAKNPEKLEEFGKNGRNLILSVFSKSVCSHQYHQLIELI